LQIKQRFYADTVMKKSLAVSPSSNFRIAFITARKHDRRTRFCPLAETNAVDIPTPLRNPGDAREARPDDI
jgi:hypothetical protein